MHKKCTADYLDMNIYGGCYFVSCHGKAKGARGCGEQSWGGVGMREGGGQQGWGQASETKGPHACSSSSPSPTASTTLDMMKTWSLC